MNWEDILKEEIQKSYFKELVSRVNSDKKKEKVFPEKNNLFRALELTPFENIKVVILGQDPYHGQGQANGLAFSVNKGNKLPPSLWNIFQELFDDMGIDNTPVGGDLSAWAEQGVLLLNSILTVIEDKPGSHANIGWEKFTSYIIESISKHKENVVFVLWGKFAQSKKSLIDVSKHKIVESPHPSPLSAYRGFFGSKPFSKINEVHKIDWVLK